MEQIKEYFRLTLKYINKYSHNPLPEVYTVWYEYVVGERVKLREELDYYINANLPISEKFILKLFKKYFTPDFSKEAVNILKTIKLKILDLTKVLKNEHEFHNERKENLNNIKSEFHQTDLEGAKEFLNFLAKEIDMLIEREANFTEIILKSYNDFDSIKEELEQLREESKKDPLTGLLNRRGFDLAIEKILKDEISGDISLIFVDIDDFKKFNDKYGHLIGDEVLKFIANILKRNLKGKDIIARFGGEEIIILVTNTPYENVVKLAEYLRKEIADKRLIIKDKKEKLPQITVSMGVAKLKKGENIKSLIERADKLMYYSKTHGKNRVSTEEVLKTNSMI